MPIYEYECQLCRSKEEHLQKMSDEPIVDCNNCGEPQLRKLISAGGFKLKGQGWYASDFRDQDRVMADPTKVKPKDTQ